MTTVRLIGFSLVTAGVMGCLGPTTGPRPAPTSAPFQPIAQLPPSALAGSQSVWSSDGQTRVSRWYLNLGGDNVTLTINSAGSGSAFNGFLVNSDGSTDVVDHINWDDATGVLQLRRVGAGFWQWIHARAVEGVLVGRASSSGVGPEPPTDASQLNMHVTGWNDYYFSRDIVPRVFDVQMGNKHARLRLDRDGSGVIVGRFKVYADDDVGDAAEEVEYDVEVQRWDGHLLHFTRSASFWTQTFTGIAEGRTVSGTMLQTNDPVAYGFSGARAALLTFGFATHDSAARADWQARTRRQLAHLMMADNPAPLTLSVQRRAASLSIPADSLSPDRDDDVSAHPADYSIDEVTILATLPNPYGGDALTRTLHGYLTTPSASAPPGGWPAVVTLNGHDGSAAGTLDPYQQMYWYGDAWARRGFVVLTLDIGHRPVEDRASLYGDYTDGDEPDTGNATHPAIKASGLDSDWAEDGERVWDVLRGVDYLASLGSVDSTHVAVTGLSMGAEVATMAGALDPRISAVLPAGYAPELEVMAWHGNHPCWLWNNGNPLDYFDVADLHALIAPRALVIETGIDDAEFSSLQPSFVDAKEVTRRSRAAYADAPDNFVVYLHPGGHEYRFGDLIDGGDGTALDVEVPQATGPRWSGDLGWASDGSTTSLGVTLVDKLRGFFGIAVN